MNDYKLKIGIEEIDKELSKGLRFEEFVKFHLDSELQPYQKQLISFIKNNENISREEFAEKYQLNRMVSFNKGIIVSTPLSDNELFNSSTLKEDKSEYWIIIDDPIK